jgi:hypothetical protein
VAQPETRASERKTDRRHEMLLDRIDDAPGALSVNPEMAADQ